MNYYTGEDWQYMAATACATLGWIDQQVEKIDKLETYDRELSVIADRIQRHMDNLYPEWADPCDDCYKTGYESKALKPDLQVLKMVFEHVAITK